MGLIALYTGLILWRLFIRLDSLHYPLKTYADIAERIFGRTARHFCTVLQSIQLVINVSYVHFRVLLVSFLTVSFSLGRHHLSQ